ncbi:hypothetical protein ACFL59_16100, partial [Planctomycetota bacterium]
MSAEKAVAKFKKELGEAEKAKKEYDKEEKEARDAEAWAKESDEHLGAQKERAKEEVAEAKRAQDDLKKEMRGAFCEIALEPAKVLLVDEKLDKRQAEFMKEAAGWATTMVTRTTTKDPIKEQLKKDLKAERDKKKKLGGETNKVSDGEKKLRDAAKKARRDANRDLAQKTAKAMGLRRKLEAYARSLGRLGFIFEDKKLDPVKVDAAFGIDTSGDTRAAVNALKGKLSKVFAELQKGDPKPDMKVGLVDFWGTGNTKVHAFAGDAGKAQGLVAALRRRGGPLLNVDRGIDHAVNKLSWRKDAPVKHLFLVADEPPTGLQQHGWPAACAKARQKGIRIHTILLQKKSLKYLRLGHVQPDQKLPKNKSKELAQAELNAWRQVATSTGGTFNVIKSWNELPDTVIEILKTQAEKSFVVFDKQKLQSLDKLKKDWQQALKDLDAARKKAKEETPDVKKAKDDLKKARETEGKVRKELEDAQKKTAETRHKLAGPGMEKILVSAKADNHAKKKDMKPSLKAVMDAVEMSLSTFISAAPGRDRVGLMRTAAITPDTVRSEIPAGRAPLVVVSTSNMYTPKGTETPELAKAFFDRGSKCHVCFDYPMPLQRGHEFLRQFGKEWKGKHSNDELKTAFKFATEKYYELCHNEAVAKAKAAQENADAKAAQAKKERAEADAAEAKAER